MAAASLLRIGVSGLLAHQAALRTVGHNISNTDTPGFSRQRIEYATQTPQFGGAGYQGTGVRIESIRRIVDDFTVNQLRLDTAAFEELDSYLTNISQLDSLLADVTTGIAPGIQSFFGSLHAAADDPTSIPVRQLVMSEAEGLIKRFETIQSRLEQHNATLNQQLDTSARQITSLAVGIAALNNNIVIATGRGEKLTPNDLLDTRDELLRQLSEIVSVNVVVKAKNAVDVFIGNGQALVVGNLSNELRAVPGETDPFRKDLAFVSGNVQQTVSSLIKGGELGGILAFRNEVLDKSINSVGRLGLTIANAINEQHALGLDLDGMFGGLFFADINGRTQSLARVVADKDNLSGNETRISVNITDTNQLTESDYILEFPGPGGRRFILTRVDNGRVIEKGILAGVLPDTIEADGFQISVETGEVQAGDRFLIQPTRFGARDLGIELERPGRLAIASAINANASLGNEGDATIISTKALDITTRAFEVPGELSPPLVIQFTSETTYDVLDNTNPARTVDLVPPLRNLRYTPGIRNDMLPDSPGQTAVTSDGLLAGRLPNNYVLTPTDGSAENGYVPETLSVTTTDPDTGIVTLQPDVFVTAGQSAKSIASTLSGLTGVNASARTKLYLSDFSNQLNDFEPMVLTINGVQVNMPTNPDEPSLLSPNYLADLISANIELQELGITGRSDGEILTLESVQGEDITVAVRGDASDRFTVRDLTGGELLMTGAGGSSAATLTGTMDRSAGFDFEQGGPYSFTISVNGGVSEVITLTGNQVLGSDVAAEIQNKIDASSAIGAGDVIVSMGIDGRMSITTSEVGEFASLEIISNSPAAEYALGFPVESNQGADLRHEVTVGGILNVVLEDGVVLTSNAIASNGNLFQAEPEAQSTFLGYQVTLDGVAQAGDKFTLEYNIGGVSDNRNGIALTAIESTKLIDNSAVNLQESYGRLVEFIGALTSQSQINTEASQSLLQASQLNRDAISGVNLDEEAADLIRFELAYNASAQVISVARNLFETLINTFR